MYKLAIFVLLVASPALGAPNGLQLLVPRSDAPALLHEETHDDLGQYHYRYITVNGMQVEERGRLVSTADGAVVPVVEGQYSYVGPDGKTYATKYSSSIEGGFQASGDHLPVAPEPVPAPAV